MSRSFAPPPTRFGAAATAQGKAVATVAHQPPPTRFAAAAASPPVQAKAMATAACACHAAPPTRFAQTPAVTQAKAAPSLWLPSRPAVVLPSPAAPTPRRGAIQRMDSEYESSEDEFEDDDDGDYEPNPPRRPSQPSSIFGKIYDPSNGVTESIYVKFPCMCTNHHSKCNKRGNMVYLLSSNYCNMSPIGKRTPRLVRPPVCHIYPWQRILDKAEQLFSPDDDLKKFLCWGNLSNLTTGYHRCNSADGDSLPSGVNMTTIGNYVRKLKQQYDADDGDWSIDSYGF